MTPMLLLDEVLPAVYGTLIVGALTFIVGLSSLAASVFSVIVNSRTSTEVAKLNAQTAHETKKLDYKHESYKKILDRRLAALESAQHFLGLVGIASTDSLDHRLFPKSCESIQSLEEIIELMEPLNAQAIWLGQEYSSSIGNFYELITSIRATYIQNSTPTHNGASSIANDKIIQALGKQEYDRWHLLIRDMNIAAANTLRDLHNIEGFYDELDRSAQAARRIIT